MQKMLLSAALAVILLNAACASKPPPRQAYQGQDTVGAIEKSMLVGKWQARVLNPVKGESTEPFNIEFKADNTSVYNVKDTQSGLGLEFEMKGTYTIEGDIIRSQMTDVRETTGNPVGSLAARFGNAFKQQASGTANMYEASSSRLVLVGDAEGQAQELTRLE